jgi:hypothetical protein
MMMSVVVPPLLVVVVIVPVLRQVASTVVVKMFPNRVRRAIAPVEHTACLAVGRAANPATTLQKGKVLDYLQVVAEDVDMAALEVDRVVVVRQPSVWLGDHEPNLGGDVAWVLAPGPQVEGPGVFSTTRLLL